MSAEDGQMSQSDPIRWVSWPLRDEPPRKSALLIGIILLAAGLAAWGLGPFFGVLALVFVTLSVGPYFLPKRFEVSARGVKVFFPLFNRDRPWSTYKRYDVHRDGVFLGTFPAPSRLDSFRGDFVRFSRAADREAVMALVRANVGGKGAGKPDSTASGAS